jgi:tRNA-2-methylthio-N6-dimethylallyladenosine synthase
MEDEFLPVEVTAERMERLRAVVERSALRKHAARVGRVEEVVVEGPSKRDPSVTTGRTGQNKLVHFAAPGGRAIPSGSFALVAVSESARHHLTGDLVEVTARPSYRVRIPVSAS